MLLFTDDTVVPAESPTDFQAALDVLFLAIGNMYVNTAKIKTF